MEKVLDGSGLKQVWNKIEERSLPVKYLTQNEYDDLSEEDKRGTLFIVDSVGDPESLFPFGNAEIYSTKEVRIGTWTDGKPLYRVVITFNLPSKTGWSKVANEITDLDDITGIRAVYNDTANAEYRVAPYYYGTVNDMTGFIFAYSKNGTNHGGVKGLYASVFSNGCFGLPVTVIIEYTKTTDKPDNATQALVSDLKIEEYDTTIDGCDWHVRKWSNGYCEFIGNASFTILPKDWTQSGNVFVVSSGGMKRYTYPFTLNKRYFEQLSVDATGGVVSINYSESPNPLIKTDMYGFTRPSALTMDNLIFLNFYITGRWK